MARSDVHKLADDLIELYAELLVPFMRVRRDMPFPSEPEREETDGEHAFSLGMIGITVNERLKLGLDNGKIAQYSLIHDLVEAHAGDVSARASDEDLAIKRDREHEAYLIIRKQFETSVPWIPKLIEKYESRVDEEAKFVYVTDKCMGSLTRMAGDGARWSEYYPTAEGYHKVVKRLREKAETFPALLELFDDIHNELDIRRKQYKKDGK